MEERFRRRYGDDERRFAEPAPREYGYEGRRGSYEDRSPRSGHERGFLDRAGDELRSWFGDEEAEMRRREDERRARWRGRPAPPSGEGEGWRRGETEERERRAPDGDVDERVWAEQWGYVDDPYERRAMPGGRSRDQRWSEGPRPGRGARGDYWVADGPHAGRGPKGYRRSDGRILEDVCDLLCEHGALDASSIEVQVVAGEVTLLGFIPTRPQKRLAEDLADSVSGVKEVHNQLRLSQAPDSPSATTPPPPSPQDWRNRAA
jgi:hypothetical protein